jgi:hypothetical protein
MKAAQKPGRFRTRNRRIESHPTPTLKQLNEDFTPADITIQPRHARWFR